MDKISRVFLITVLAGFLCGLGLNLGVAAKRVNGRLIPEAKDFSSVSGNDWRYKAYDTLLTEVAALLSETQGGNYLDIDSLSTNYIRSNPNVDSLAGNIIFSGQATWTKKVSLDSIRSNPNVDSLAGNIRFTGRPTFDDNTTFGDSISGTCTVAGRMTFKDNLIIGDSLTCGGAGAGNLTVGGGAEIDSITINDSTNDTLIIKIGGKTFKIDCDSDA
jgi:hypothetical protein